MINSQNNPNNVVASYNAATILQVMAKMPLVGIIIPQRWYKAIRFEGQSDFIAILLLAEIVDCYKPLVECDGVGQPFTYRKKFQGDKLQRSNDSFARLFNISVVDIEAALSRLECAGYIICEYQTMDTPLGRMDGVQTIIPVVEAIKAITMIGFVGESV